VSTGFFGTRILVFQIHIVGFELTKTPALLFTGRSIIRHKPREVHLFDISSKGAVRRFRLSDDYKRHGSNLSTFTKM
jgi:hypothetical protein